MGDKGEKLSFETFSGPRKPGPPLLLKLADRVKSFFSEPMEGEQIAKRASNSLPLKLSDGPLDIIFAQAVLRFRFLSSFFAWDANSRRTMEVVLESLLYLSRG